jgi:hypothetical protein
MPAHVAEDMGDAWLAWLYARIQLDEAKALIGPASPTENNPSEPRARTLRGSGTESRISFGSFFSSERKPAWEVTGVIRTLVTAG